MSIGPLSRKLCLGKLVLLVRISSPNAEGDTDFALIEPYFDVSELPLKTAYKSRRDRMKGTGVSTTRTATTTTSTTATPATTTSTSTTTTTTTTTAAATATTAPITTTTTRRLGRRYVALRDESSHAYKLEPIRNIVRPTHLIPDPLCVRNFYEQDSSVYYA